MKILLKSFLMMLFLASTLAILNGCDDDEDPGPQLTGVSETYSLGPVSDQGISGTVMFAKRDDDQVVIFIQLTGTQSGGTHPAHIHANSAAETGGIVLDLTPVNGGTSETVVSALNDGTSVTYEDFLNFDGHVNVHMSSDNLGTLIAQGDIGQNELTGNTTVYALEPGIDDAVTGTATFAERKNGFTLVTVQMTNVAEGASHNSHIHANTIAEGGGIVINLNPVVGPGGTARTSVEKFNDTASGTGAPVTYSELIEFNGHLNVHATGGYLGQVDIGQNKLTGDEKVYTLQPGVNQAVTGTATFAKRKNGTTLVTVELSNVADASSHSSHIHANTIVEGGGIVISLNPVVGPGGVARTNVTKFDDTGTETGAAVTYDELLEFDGHLNVHATGGYLGQVDIGQNELTGASKVYTLEPGVNPDVTGTATFAERKNGTTLVTVELSNVADASSHNSHIHANTIAEGGGIVISLNPVVGPGGVARTNVTKFDDTGTETGAAVTYDQLLEFDGHLNVHATGGYLGQVDIGENELTGDTKQYVLSEVGGSGVSGTATFAKRKNGKTKITISLTGTVTGGDHPAHIHANDVATGGSVVLTLENVAGNTGKSVTSAHALNDTTPITYDQLIAYDGHINVHLSALELSTLIAQGNIGSNAL